MDDTVADMVSRQLEWYANKFGVTMSRQDLDGKKIYECIPQEHVAEAKGFPDHPEFFEDLTVIDNAVESIRRLSEHYQIYFASAAMEHPNSFGAKYRWLKQHFGFISEMNYIFCGYKGILNCDFLVDDNPDNIDAFTGLGFLYDAPHNRDSRDYQRICSWQEAEKLFMDLIQ